MGYSERNGVAAHTLPELVERFPTLQARLSLQVQYIASLPIARSLDPSW